MGWIEDRIFTRNLPGWTSLDDGARTALLDRARYDTYTRGGSGRVVLAALAGVFATFALVFALGLYLLDQQQPVWWLSPLGGALVVLVAGSLVQATRARQLLPALRALLDEPT